MVCVLEREIKKGRGREGGSEENKKKREREREREMLEGMDDDKEREGVGET